MSLSRIGEYRFGPFRLLPDQSVLLRGDEPVRVGSRALGVLALLVKNPGSLITKQEIMDEVWPDSVVLDANLAVHMSALRRALEDDDPTSPLIVTVPGRGYRFAIAVTSSPKEGPYKAVMAGGSNLPLLLTRLIGRAEEVRKLATDLPLHRLLTIVGTGGVGKTSLALYAPEQQLHRWHDGVWIADFAAIADADLVPAVLATVLGLEVRSSNPIPALAAALADKEMLLLFDNCEHLVEPVAMLVNAILQSARSVAILATSREPFAVPGESVLRLEPLGLPPVTDLVGAREALAYGAIELLSERSRALDPDFELGDEDALAASLICRKLGGVPLAIEFASALVPIFGVRGLAARLDDRLRLLGDGHRSTLPRHRTLNAALDWSFQLLDPDDRLLLRRLAVFSGGFTIEAAAAVFGTDRGEVATAEAIARLVRKSLVSPDIRGSILRFRLLETTRAFALDALESDGDLAETEDLHARHFARAVNGEEGRPAASADHVPFTPDLDNIRTALRWAMSEQGDLDLALSLGSGALPIWLGHSLLTECGTRMTALMDRVDPAVRRTPQGAAIDIAIQATGIFTYGDHDKNYSDWSAREQAATQSDDLIDQVRLLLGLWSHNIRLPDYALADKQSVRLNRYADEADAWAPQGDAPLAFLIDEGQLRAMALWARGTSLHHIGQLRAARQCFEQFLACETPAMRTFFMTITGFDRRSDAIGLLGLTKCLQGDVGAALLDARSCIAEARSTGKALPLCEGLQWGCVIMLLLGEPVARLTPLVDELVSTARNHSLLSHYGVGLGLEGCLAASAGRPQEAIGLIAQCLDQLVEAHYGPFDPFFVGELAAAHAASGDVPEAHNCIAAYERRRKTPDGFLGPELLRRKAMVSSLLGETGAAETALRSALDLASAQGAQLWRWRAGNDLAALIHLGERPADAEALRRELAVTVPEPVRQLQASELT
jgi:predicted ATPase/DNA-binding winged helix-turn-helix (wHTH) protein